MLAKVKNEKCGDEVGNFLFMDFMKLDGIYEFYEAETTGREIWEDWYQVNKTGLRDAVYHISWLEVVNE